MSSSQPTALPLPPAPADGRFRLLLVEDDLAAARLILGFLGRTGFECFHAGDAEAAISAFKKLTPHLLLTENTSAEIDGAALCRWVREKSGIPILLFGPNDESSEVAALKVGADDYIIHPLRPAVLMARVVSSLRRCYRYQAPVKWSNPFGLDLDESASDGVLPSGWARCDTCGYVGPRPKFERENALGGIKMTCPNCDSSDHVVISLD